MVLFCDSNCELWHDEVERLNLKVIKMPYTIDGQEYYYDMGKETDFAAFYEKIRNKIIPTTAALNECDYIEYFEPFLKEGEDIFYITFSHKMSATFESMDKAIAVLNKRYPKRTITIYDTKNICMGAGYIVYQAAKKWNAGASAEELIKYLDFIRQHTAIYFGVDDLFHLKRGGRLSGAAAAFGSILGVKPILSVDDEGKLSPVFKVKGAKMLVSKLAALYNELNGGLSEYDEIFILHADSEKKAEELKEKIKELTGGKAKVKVQIIGPVVATHCGPGVIGIVFYKA